MYSRRTALIVMLIAAEVLIVGFAIHSLRGPSSWAHNESHGMSTVAFSAHPIAAIDAGASPVVQIRDANSQVTLTTSSDGRVHVQDETSFGSMSWNASGKIPQLQVSRTSDGVNIERPDEDDMVSFGFSSSHREIAVQVPPGSRIEIVKCAGADVTGIHNDVSVTSDDGDIGLYDLNGNVVAHSGDGHIEIARSQGSSIELGSDDGRIVMTDLQAESLSAHSGDGSISGTGVVVAGSSPKATVHSDDGSVEVDGNFAANGSYEITSSDGHIVIALAAGSNTTVSASTGDGSVTLDGQSFNDDNNAQETLKVGDGSGTMRVSSDDGSIHITTNGAH